jgi:methylated-DNA-protein-cysteine methyltransferase related protein
MSRPIPNAPAEPVLDSPRAAQIIRRVRAVPAGFVSTYGDLCPDAPRLAGRALARCDDARVPWQRIVRADGSLAKGPRQRRLLIAEGVPFRGPRVEMQIARVPAEALDQLTESAVRSPKASGR